MSRAVVKDGGQNPEDITATTTLIMGMKAQGKR
jgi:hypothetical protein